MHPTLQLLERHRSELLASTVHWFDVPEPTDLVKPNDRQFNLNWSTSNNAQATDIDWPCSELNVLFYPKAKDRLFWWLKTIENRSNSEQRLWVVGENNGGIKSLGKRLSESYDCVKVDSARHCVLFEITQKKSLEFDMAWTKYSYLNNTIYSLPGVFSAGKLDKGTQVLLTALPSLKGNILEFGGGCGVLTTAIAQQPQVKKVTALEIDLLAVRSSLKTFHENDLSDKANTLWSAGTEALPTERFDAIVTNPPFHTGIKTSYEPTESFFLEAHQWLRTGGRLIWVANEFLNYESLLTTHFQPPIKLRNERGFNVFEAVRR